MRTPLKGSVYVVIGTLALGAAETPPVLMHTIMPLSHADLIAHLARRQSLPRKQIDPLAVQQLIQASPLLATATATSGFSLLGNFAYTPSLWNQGGCGDCWVWGSTAAASISYGKHTGTPAGFSVQYLNSNYNGGSGDGWACCGGDAALFASFYQSQGKFIPLSNAGAAYTDLNSACGGTSATRASAIATNPNVPFTAIADQVIVTTGVTQAQAIANIKAVLNGGQAVTFAYYLPGAGWNDFEQFWSSSTEATAWPDIDKYSGSNFDSGAGGHLTCLVGYDDSNASWIVLNSWGTTNGRPDGTFEIPQAMGYNDYLLYGGTQMDQFEFDVYDLAWPASTHTVTAAITAPAHGTTVNSGAATTFTGSGTDSSSQATLSYAWAFGDGGTGTGPSASHTYTNTGSATATETVTLTATDGSGAKGSGTLTLYVAPVPKNTLSATITSPSAAVTLASGATQSFTGTATDSSRTATLAYAWTFGDGSSATGASVSHAFTNSGTASASETVTLTVTDNTGVSAKATRTVTVLPRNQLSVAITSPAAAVTLASGAAQNFAGTATDSSRTATLTYLWNFGDGTSATGAAASHAFTNGGSANASETVTLTVTDSTGVSAQATRTVTVTPPPRNALSVAITNPPGLIEIGNGGVVPFVATATDSSSTAALTYTWNFGDGSTATGPNPSHKFTCPGPSTMLDNVVLTVTDHSGAKATTSMMVYVMPTPGNIVVVSVTTPAKPVTIASGTPQSFACKATDSSSSAKLTYYWNFGDNICGTGASVSHTYTNATGAPVTLSVNVLAIDTTGSYSTGSFPITITPAGTR